MLPHQAVPYVPPPWCTNRLLNPPQHGRLLLANLPTPMYQLTGRTSFFQTLGTMNVNFYIKRDDSTGGVELGGNKIRKLEFLLADALAQGCDSVVTIGGEQSNHCRATAAATRMVGLEPHLILRTRQPDDDLGLVGNLLMDRMVGSSIYTCTPGEYGRVGSNELVRRLCAHLDSKGRKAYGIPVGGSNGLGSWGYINGVNELLHQLEQAKAPESSSNISLEHIAFACGSGGTAAGVAIGIALAYATKAVQDKAPMVHAIGVCDDPDYFYNYVAGIATEMGLVTEHGEPAEAFVRQHMVVHQGKGLGYAVSTPEELAFVSSFAQETGIVLDPVYSGKALYNFMKHVEQNKSTFQGSSILFWHTGGALGLYDKIIDLLPSLVRAFPCRRLDLYGKGTGVDLSEPET